MWVSTVIVGNSVEAPEGTKNRTGIDPAIPLLGVHPMQLKSRVSERRLHPVSAVVLCAIAKVRNQLSVHQLKDGQGRCGINTRWNIIQP
jgi:hypothetical protein